MRCTALRSRQTTARVGLRRSIAMFATALTVTIAGVHSTATAQSDDLAGYFGFDGLEVIKIGRGAGPLSSGDVNGDGHADLIIVNDFASRIEIHYQKPNASPDDPISFSGKTNEFPEHWQFRRQNISVTHAVGAVAVHDFDDDGLNDIIYAGIRPSEIVFLRQSAPGTFTIERKHRVRNLAANRSAFSIANLIGDDAPELISIVNENIVIWPLEGDELGSSTELSAGDRIIAFQLEDYNGDGRLDVAGILPDDAAPLRLWLGRVQDGTATLGPQARFEMPPLRDLKPVRLPNQDAARIATVERASKRIVVYELKTERVSESGNRDAALEAYSFTNGADRDRDIDVADVNGDGLLDLIATDTDLNAVMVFEQAEGKGLLPGRSYPSLSDLKFVVARNVDDDPSAEIFVLSEKEGVVGRADREGDGFSFPVPVSISEGWTPVAFNMVELQDGPHLAVVVKSSRDHSIDLIGMDGERETVKLGSLSRSPETILPLDADQDGRTDLLLFTRDKPMMMLHAGEDGFDLRESDDMGQFGLVQAADADNTGVFDIDGDGQPELLIADRNFVRAVRYESDPGAGVSPGWQVVKQINSVDRSAQLVSLTLLGDQIVAADGENRRLVFMGQRAADWEEIESVNIRGFDFDSIIAGSFTGDGSESILAVGDEGFAVVRLSGDRHVLNEVAGWRTSNEQQLQHELFTGDVNSDGYTDMISLDAGEQMCEVFTFSELGNMFYALGFQVFESKIFSGGEPREYEPSQGLVADVTGDDAADIVLLAHDRVLIFPQMKMPR